MYLSSIFSSFSEFKGTIYVADDMSSYSCLRFKMQRSLLMHGYISGCNFVSIRLYTKLWRVYSLMNYGIPGSENDNVLNRKAV